MTVYHQVP